MGREAEQQVYARADPGRHRGAAAHNHLPGHPTSSIPAQPHSRTTEPSTGCQQPIGIRAPCPTALPESAVVSIMKRAMTDLSPIWDLLP